MLIKEGMKIPPGSQIFTGSDSYVKLKRGDKSKLTRTITPVSEWSFTKEDVAANPEWSRGWEIRRYRKLRLKTGTPDLDFGKGIFKSDLKIKSPTPGTGVVGQAETPSKDLVPGKDPKRGSDDDQPI